MEGGRIRFAATAIRQYRRVFPSNKGYIETKC